MAMLVMLLTMAAGLIGGWAQAVQIEGHKVKKLYDTVGAMEQDHHTGRRHYSTVTASGRLSMDRAC